MQACYIGSKLFSQSKESGTMEAISFLRMILYSCHENAKDVVKASELPPE
jgi:hypothetical protein